VVDEPAPSTTRAENKTSTDFSFVLVRQEPDGMTHTNVPEDFLQSSVLVLYLDLAISLFQTDVSPLNT
jgi:hypothetical protein